MKTILWKPSKKIIKNSNLRKYEIYLKNIHNLYFKNNFSKIHEWSVKNPKLFSEFYLGLFQNKRCKKRNMQNLKENL